MNTQKTLQSQDGVRPMAHVIVGGWEPDGDNYEIVVGGEVVGWAATEQAARQQYIERLRVQNEHASRNGKE